MGLAAIVILQNGLRLSEWPAELAGILTGVLLVSTIALERFVNRGEREERRAPQYARVAILCAAVVAVALLHTREAPGSTEKST